MLFNSIIFFSYTIFLFLSLLGYGNLAFKYLNIDDAKSKNVSFIGEKGFFSLLLLIPLSLLIHFFFSFSYIVSLIIYFSGILFFFYKSNFKINKKKLLYFFIIIIFFVPYFILISYHDDFYYYHLPYLNVLDYSKIIFGLSNLNTVLTYPQNLWFDVFALFKLPIIKYNGLQSFNGVFTIFFIMYCIENFVKSKNLTIKIISIFYLIFTLSLFSRLRDHGAEIIPQFLMLLFYMNVMKIWINENEYKSSSLIKIIVFFTLAFLLRISSVIIIPLLFILLIQNYKLIKEIIKKVKTISFIFFLILIVIIKNLIVSGCFIYPISKTCFSQNIVPWSVGQDIPKINENVILSYTRGWMIYAKINTPNSNKFIFNANKNILNHKDYLSKGVKFWIKYWLKDADIIRILNMFFIGIFMLIIFIIGNIGNFKLLKEKNIISSKKLASLFYLTTPIMFWLFISTPSNRYGGYAIFIAFVSFLVSIIINFLFSNKLNYKLPILFLILLSCFFFSLKNILRLNENLTINNLPWPNLTTLNLGIDFEEEAINGIKINYRKPTNKLIMGKITDKNNYVLHCGNIKMLCTPIKKKSCIKNIENKYDYLFIYSDEKNCIKLLKKNALY